MRSVRSVECSASSPTSSGRYGNRTSHNTPHNTQQKKQTGNYKEAIRLTVRCLKDPAFAIQYVEDSPDADLWEELIQHIIQSPEMIGQFLDHIFGHYDVAKFLRRIPDQNRLVIPHETQRLAKGIFSGIIITHSLNHSKKSGEQHRRVAAALHVVPPLNGRGYPQISHQGIKSFVCGDTHTFHIYIGLSPCPWCPTLPQRRTDDVPRVPASG